MLLLLSVQVGGGGDQTGVRVDVKELVAGSGQQAVPHHGILLWNIREQIMFYITLKLEALI